MDAPSVSTSLTLGPSMEIDEVILDLHGVSPLSMGGEGRGHGLATLWLVSGVVFVTCLVIIVHLTLEKHITYSIHTSIHRYIFPDHSLGVSPATGGGKMEFARPSGSEPLLAKELGVEGRRGQVSR